MPRQSAARQMEPPVVILVHGAWHGPWAWAEVIERLSAEGIRTVALDLPSKGTDTAALGDMHGDAAVVRAAVADAGAPALVVAHSYGGLPVSEGGADAAHLLYVAAFMLEPGESLLGLRGGVDPDWWITSDDGRIVVPDDPKHVFYADCPRGRRRARGGRTRSPEQGRLPPGAPLGRLEDRAVDLRRLRARQRDPAGAPGAHVTASGHGQPHGREPLPVPLATRRGHGDHPGDAGSGGRGSLTPLGRARSRTRTTGAWPRTSGQARLCGARCERPRQAYSRSQSACSTPSAYRTSPHGWGQAPIVRGPLRSGPCGRRAGRSRRARRRRRAGSRSRSPARRRGRCR